MSGCLQKGLFSWLDRSRRAEAAYMDDHPFRLARLWAGCMLASLLIGASRRRHRRHRTQEGGLESLSCWQGRCQSSSWPRGQRASYQRATRSYILSSSQCTVVLIAHLLLLSNTQRPCCCPCASHLLRLLGSPATHHWQAGEVLLQVSRSSRVSGLMDHSSINMPYPSFFIGADLCSRISSFEQCVSTPSSQLSLFFLPAMITSLVAFAFRFSYLCSSQAISDDYL